MRRAQRFASLPLFGHRIPVQSGHQSIRRSGRIKKNCRHSATNSRALHHTDQESHHGQQSIRSVPENRDQYRQRDSHNKSAAKPRCCTNNDAQKETKGDHHNRDRNPDSKDRKGLWPRQHGHDPGPNVVKNTHHQSPFGGSSTLSSGKSKIAIRTATTISEEKMRIVFTRPSIKAVVKKTRENPPVTNPISL